MVPAPALLSILTDTVRAVDTDWMRERLEQYLALCERYEAIERGNGYRHSPQMTVVSEEAQRLQATVERILSALDPELVDDLRPLGYEMSNIDRRIRRALGILDDRDEWSIRLAPDSPSLSADGMHPMVWSAARTVWGTGQFRIAVQQATVALSAHIKTKTGSALNDRELVTQAFAPDQPKPGQVRLHLPGDQADRTWQSRQQGLHLLAQGAFAGIRNVAAHTDVEWTEHEALEHLAILSVVARWADTAAKVKPDA